MLLYIIILSCYFLQFDVFERQQSNPSLPTAVYDSVRSGSNNSALMENLQSQIKMRDGEIQQLQVTRKKDVFCLVF